MSCKHPLKAFVTGDVNPETGKPIYKVRPYSTISITYKGRVITEFIEIPCGQCIACRLEYSRQWAIRCLLESKYHEKNCFLTLTYDDDHLPPCRPICDLDGAVIGYSPVHSLCKDDFRSFMKRFRQRLCDKYEREHPGCSKDELPHVRFFACGEYSPNLRPHYHAIIFGYDFSADRVPFNKNFRGDSYYISNELSKLWPFGYHIIADCEFDACAYVSRYILKKQKGKSSYVYDDLNIEPEFTLMSRKPGIARWYYDDHRDEMYAHDSFYISDLRRAIKLRPPKYYDKLYDIEDPEFMRKLKADRRSRAESISQQKDAKSLYSHEERLQREEESILRRTKILQERRLE